MSKSTIMNRDMITKKDLENKYVFWDIDGTLAAYRFNGHVSDSEGTDNGMSIKEIARTSCYFFARIVK